MGGKGEEPREPSSTRIVEATVSDRRGDACRSVGECVWRIGLVALGQAPNCGMQLPGALERDRVPDPGRRGGDLSRDHHGGGANNSGSGTPELYVNGVKHSYTDVGYGALNTVVPLRMGANTITIAVGRLCRSVTIKRRPETNAERAAAARAQPGDGTSPHGSRRRARPPTARRRRPRDRPDTRNRSTGQRRPSG